MSQTVVASDLDHAGSSTLVVFIAFRDFPLLLVFIIVYFVLILVEVDLAQHPGNSFLAGPYLQNLQWILAQLRIARLLSSLLLSASERISQVVDDVVQPLRAVHLAHRRDLIVR